MNRALISATRDMCITSTCKQQNSIGIKKSYTSITKYIVNLNIRHFKQRKVSEIQYGENRTHNSTVTGCKLVDLRQLITTY